MAAISRFMTISLEMGGTHTKGYAFTAKISSRHDFMDAVTGSLSRTEAWSGSM